MNSLANDFPILKQKVHGQSLVYLDSGATSQKPQCVLDTYIEYYHSSHANVHRGVHELSGRATDAYEKTRAAIKDMINAESTEEIIFTSGTTASINLVAQSYGRTFFTKGDEVILSTMEHHSNIVPWQLLQKDLNIKIKVIPLLENGELDLQTYEKLFSPRTKLVALTHASNVIGTVNPIKEMIALAHSFHVPVLIDGAQSFPHMAVDMQALDCDFFAFSAHKAYGPTGVGVLYGKKKILQTMPPYQGGGSMISQVTFEETTFSELPYKFEAGTPNIASIVSFKTALDYLKKISFAKIHADEQKLLNYARKELSAIPGLILLGQPSSQIGVLAWVMQGVHPHDVATILDREGIAVRAGHHCAMPLIQHFKIPACVRVSLGLYNTEKDIDRLCAGIYAVKRVFNV